MHPYLDEATQDRIAAALKDAIAGYRTVSDGSLSKMPKKA